MTYNGTTATAYVDGQNQGEGPVTANTAVPGNGLALAGGNWDFADVAVYPTALTPAKIDAHWTAGASPTATACASTPTYPYAKSVLSNKPDVYYPLDDVATSRVAYDRSGGCHNGAYSSASSIFTLSLIHI